MAPCGDRPHAKQSRPRPPVQSECGVVAVDHTIINITWTVSKRGRTNSVLRFSSRCSGNNGMHYTLLQGVSESTGLYICTDPYLLTNPYWPLLTGLETAVPVRPCSIWRYLVELPHSLEGFLVRWSSRIRGQPTRRPPKVLVLAIMNWTLLSNHISEI